MHYIDTSVLAAYYIPEHRTKDAEKALAKAENPFISPLVEIELYCVIARKVRSHVLDASVAKRIHSQFQLHIADGVLRMVDIGTAEYALARDWLARLETSLRVLDALHLAVAFANGLMLVTADKELAEVARHFGVRYRIVS